MATFTVTTLIDENDAGATVASPGGAGLSLREALALANANGTATNDTINFNAGLSGGALLLTSGQLAITTSGIAVNGDINNDSTPDITISAATSIGGDDATSRVFKIDGAGTITAALNGLVIRDGNVFEEPLLIDQTGGGILVGQGDALVLTNSTVTDN